MSYIKNAKWITCAADTPDAALTFTKTFETAGKVKSAELQISALGVYRCFINAKEVTPYPLAPGWTNYAERTQFQTVGVTSALAGSNKISVNLGRGWRMFARPDREDEFLASTNTALIAALKITYADGREETVFTDSSWTYAENKTRSNNIYNGEVYDCTYEQAEPAPVRELDLTTDMLIPQQGEKIAEHERISGKRIFITPKGETVVDFGQELTGWVEFKYQGEKGSEMSLKHFEVLDKDGNVYTENLRSAEQLVKVINDGKLHTFRPSYTFYGFRYIMITGFPETIAPYNFTAVAVYSDLKRTGYMKTSSELVNKLIHNAEWGQRGNFLDVPTDCPQRDERLGWTGDAQVFARTAMYFTDVRRFFDKWLDDCASEFTEKDGLPHVVPKVHWDGSSSAAWADCCTIIPWRLYEFYGDRAQLEKNYPLMKSWVDWVARQARKEETDGDFDKSRDPFLWNNGGHFGDWLALDRRDGRNDSVGWTNTDYIAQCMFANSVDLLIKADKALGYDSAEHEELYKNVVASGRKEFFDEKGNYRLDETQSVWVLALAFGLAPDRALAAERLGALVEEAGHLTTGFVATPYLMHTLSDIGRQDLCSMLLMRTEYPSWLYPVTQGATTIWERWDGQKPDGSFQDAGMNSFNHYAYGCVCEYMYARLAGIRPDGEAPGFAKINVRPDVLDGFTSVFASVET
ncbi:MAG: glycoside hydrolase family 78 protein, partial [Clostridia bacterium]|nr:glycoside hydrolase family 78 protein [Clostridia bacterium]